jgi:hypothetical protein
MRRAGCGPLKLSNAPQQVISSAGVRAQNPPKPAPTATACMVGVTAARGTSGGRRQRRAPSAAMPQAADQPSDSARNRTSGATRTGRSTHQLIGALAGCPR